MPYENLEPYQKEILARRQHGPGRMTLSALAAHLSETYGVSTTVGTLSRYLTHLNQPPGVALRDPTEAERESLDALALLTEVLTEIRGRGDEQRQAIEALAGKVAVMTATIEELERKVANSSTTGDGVSPALLRRIWLRAVVISATAVGLIATLLILLARA